MAFHDKVEMKERRKESIDQGIGGVKGNKTRRNDRSRNRQ